MNRVLEGVMRGEPVKKLCRPADMPSESTWYRWLASNEELQRRYILANRVQTLKLEEDVIPIADGCQLNKAAVAKARLRISARERKIQRMTNKVYGKAGSWEEFGDKESLPPMVQLSDLRAPSHSGGAE